MPPRQLDHASSSSDSIYDGEDLYEQEILRLSSSDSSEGPSPAMPKLDLAPDTDGADEMSNDFAELEELRKNLQKNLRLRPIRSKGRLPKLDNDEMRMNMPGAFPMSAKMKQEFDLQSPVNPQTGFTAIANPLTTMPGHARRERGAGQVTRMSGDIGSSPTVSGSLPSVSTTPMKLQSKPRSRTKQPPPALSSLILHPTGVTGNENITLSRPQHVNSVIPTISPDSPLSSNSPTSSIVSSYFTPVGDTPITSKFVYYGTTLSTISSELENEETSETHTASSPTEPGSNTISPSQDMTPDHPVVSQNRLTSDKPLPISASHLFTLLLKGFSRHERPLVIDTRAPAAHAASRIRGSVNIAIPSLILKRCRKMTASSMLRSEKSDFGPSPNVVSGGAQTGGKGGFQNMEALRQFVVGERAKEDWIAMLSSLNRAGRRTVAGELVWDGDVIVYDEEMDQDAAETTWMFMEVIMPLVGRHGGRVYYLEGGIVKGAKDSQMRKVVEFGPAGSNADEEYPIHFVSASSPSFFEVEVRKVCSRQKSRLRVAYSSLTQRGNYHLTLSCLCHCHPLPYHYLLQAQIHCQYHIRHFPLPSQMLHVTHRCQMPMMTFIPQTQQRPRYRNM